MADFLHPNRDLATVGPAAGGHDLERDAGRTLDRLPGSLERCINPASGSARRTWATMAPANSASRAAGLSPRCTRTPTGPGRWLWLCTSMPLTCKNIISSSSDT